MWDALRRVNATQARLEHFHSCGAACWIQRLPGTDRARIVCNQCHDRLCIPCQTARSKRIQSNLHPLIRTEQSKLITLTLRHSNTPLSDQIDRLYRSFHALKKRKLFRQNVSAGIAFLEIKLSERTGRWHVHMHAVVLSKFIDQRQLSQAWHSVTGDSSIVDVRKIRDPETAARYVTKYVTKPADSSVFTDHAKLDEFVLALKGRRLYNPFGDWRALDFERSDDDEAQWENVCSLETLIHECRRGAPWAVALARNLADRTPTLTTTFPELARAP